MKIRTDIMNLSLSQWEKVKAIELDGEIETSIKHFYDLVGFSGGMFFTGKANEEEKSFIKEFYDYGRSNKVKEGK